MGVKCWKGWWIGQPGLSAGNRFPGQPQSQRWVAYPRSKSSVPWTISGYRASASGRLVKFWNPTFSAERRAALGVAPILDDVATNQRENDSSPVLFQKAGDVINRKPMIHEKIADGQSPFRLGIEAYAIVGQRERLLIDTK